MNQEDAGPVHLIEDHDSGDRLLIYVTDKGAQVDLRVIGNTFWATQSQMAEMFGVDVSVVSRHISNVFAEGELPAAINLQKMQINRGAPTTFYSLNVLISVGYRVSGPLGTMFRIWATDKLMQYLTKGFVIDAPRLKAPDDHDRIAELRDIIRDIRSSEANVYAELRRICAMCQDYDPSAEQSRIFYKHMQAKLYWAVVSSTPAMVLKDRADASMPNMGLQTWPKENIRQEDAINAKNYLGDYELRELNRLTTILLDIFEDQLEIGRLTLMSEAEALLDAQLRNLNRVVLRHGGKVSADDAAKRAKKQYAIFDGKRREARKLATEKLLSEVKATESALPKPKRQRKPKATSNAG
jgi:hypothetical protein